MQKLVRKEVSSWFHGEYLCRTASKYIFHQKILPIFCLCCSFRFGCFYLFMVCVFCGIVMEIRSWLFCGRFWQSCVNYIYRMLWVSRKYRAKTFIKSMTSKRPLFAVLVLLLFPAVCFSETFGSHREYCVIGAGPGGLWNTFVKYSFIWRKT